jgi:NADH:ubiquinone oxidoreductase subunit
MMSSSSLIGHHQFVYAGASIHETGVPMAKKIQRREWTKDDLRELKALAKQKKPAPKIAKSLKRTVGATRQMAFKLGVSLDSRP